MVVSTNNDVLVVDMDSRTFTNSVSPGSDQFSSLTRDGSLLAVSEASGFGQIQFYAGAPIFQEWVGQLTPGPGSGSIFRFADNAGGIFAMDQGLATALYRGYPSGQILKLLDDGRRNQAALDVAGYGTVFLSSDAGGGSVGLYALNNGIVTPIYYNAADDVGWFSASGDGSVLVYSVYGTGSPGLHIRRNGMDTLLNGVSIYDLDNLSSFDLSDDGKYMAFSIFGGSLRLLNIRGEQTQLLGVTAPAPVISIDLPCNVAP